MAYKETRRTASADMLGRIKTADERELLKMKIDLLAGQSALSNEVEYAAGGLSQNVLNMIYLEKVEDRLCRAALKRKIAKAMASC